MNRPIDETTISSFELLGFLSCKDLKSLHLAISRMFERDMENSRVGRSSTTPDGRTSEYHLPELESKMFVIKHHINCVERMNQYWIDKKSVPKVIEQNAENTIAALIDMAETLNLSKSEKVKAYAIGMEDYPDFVKALPVYGVDTPQVANDVDENDDEAHEMSHYVVGFGKSVKQINKKLVKLGLLEEKYRISSTGKVKHFKVLTENGLRYGKNLGNTRIQGKIHPYYYESMIDELLMLI